MITHNSSSLPYDNTTQNQQSLNPNLSNQLQTCNITPYIFVFLRPQNRSKRTNNLTR
ncbi:hypothetical protein Hanom_Chr14g01298561 [Helianthus anomalus]